MPPEQPDPSPERGSTLMILRRKEVEARCKLSCTSIYRLIKLGLFPLPVRLGTQAVGWQESDLLAWIERNKGPIHARAIRKRRKAS